MANSPQDDRRKLPTGASSNTDSSPDELLLSGEPGIGKLSQLRKIATTTETPIVELSVRDVFSDRDT